MDFNNSRQTYRVWAVSAHEFVDGDVVLAQFGSSVVPAYNLLPGCRNTHKHIQSTLDQQKYTIVLNVF